jgi:selenocysteine-specific elongation factor
VEALAGRDVPTIVVGTAGHIDHGKTSLLRALTGIDADRLPEERARGMTIDVGYAHLTFDDGIELDFVDVPGHDRLIGNMLVGAGEIDAAILVVAADDGPRPQTLEHLQLLDALGVDAGLAVVTKVDLVDAERTTAVIAEVAALLAGTSLAASRIFAASSTTGRGIEDVRAALRELRDAVIGRLADAHPQRLAVDRAFAVRGRGSVVTGSLRGGPLADGAALRREPGGEQLRVRGMEVHNRSAARHPGGRTALNVTGLPVEALRRGDVLTTGSGPLAVQGTERVLVDLRSPASLPQEARRAPRRGARLRLHLGTDQVDATLSPVQTRPRAALLTLERQVAAFPGARGVLREPASGAVVAGVRVLDPRPPRGISRRRMTADRIDRLAEAVGAADPVAVADATTSLHGALASVTGLAFARDVRDALESTALELVAEHHREAPLSDGLPLPRARTALLRRLRALSTIERRDAEQAGAAVAALVDELVDTGRVARVGAALRDPTRTSARPAALAEAMARLESALSVAAPPSLDSAAAAAGCPPEGVRTLAAEGRIVRLAPDLAWATPMYQRLAAVALERARAGPLTPAAYRDATGTSRRYVLAILEDLDRRGILQRTSEGHVPGPRAPRVNPGHATGASAAT